MYNDFIFPQTIKLLKTKESNDLSISSWILWVISSFSYALYAFFVSEEFMLKFETSLEFSFCLIILLLSIYYSKNNFGKKSIKLAQNIGEYNERK